MLKKTIRVAGVPEHFNMPWQLCIEEGAFEEIGVEIDWIDVPEGTGKMCEMLLNNEVDMALVLTEGAMNALSKNFPLKIVQTYVHSPLQWGIFVDGKSPIQQLDELNGTKAAISRLGSGSHLMAAVLAHQNNWKQPIATEIVNTLDGAVAALQSQKAAFFMWDQFMTAPLVQQKIFKQIGVCPTPWPCFLWTANTQFAQENKPLIQQIQKIINTTTREFLEIPSIAQTLAVRYHLDLSVVQAWMQETKYSQSQMSAKTFDEINHQLVELGILEQKNSYQQAIL